MSAEQITCYPHWQIDSWPESGRRAEFERLSQRLDEIEAKLDGLIQTLRQRGGV